MSIKIYVKYVKNNRDFHTTKLNLPTGALDSTNGNEVMALLQDSVKKLNQTLVLITHNIDLAREADRIVRITDGKLTEE